jgi:hypothetical protein
MNTERATQPLIQGNGQWAPEPLPHAAATGSCTGVTCRFWWQVQDSSLGRLSSAVYRPWPVLP